MGNIVVKNGESVTLTQEMNVTVQFFDNYQKWYITSQHN